MDINKNQLKIIKTRGTHYEIGFTLGKECKNQIQNIIQKEERVQNKNRYTQKRYEQALDTIKPYTDILDELHGMADGACVDFEQVARLNIIELDNQIAPGDNCSSFVVHNTDNFILGHNEDGMGETDDVFILEAQFPSGFKILSLCYYGLLPGNAVTINSSGLVISCNALTINDGQDGESKRLVARRLINSHSIEEFYAILKSTQRARGQNYILIQNNLVVDIESSATNQFLNEFSGNCYHYNNFIFPEMQRYEAASTEGKDYIRSREAAKTYQSLSNLTDIKKILSSHKNTPYSFCGHGKEGGGDLKTLASVYVDFFKKKIWIGYGLACESELQAIPFDHDW